MIRKCSALLYCTLTHSPELDSKAFYKAAWSFGVSSERLCMKYSRLWGRLDYRSYYRLINYRLYYRHFSHAGIQTKDRSRAAGGEGSDALVPPLWSYATGVSWWRRLGHVPGEFIWRQRIHGCSSKLRKHANRASHWNGNNKDIY